MIIIVDKNEQDVAPEIVKQLKRVFSQVIVTNLPHRSHGNVTVTAGDINIPLDEGSILAIERKTPWDFLSSIASGHLFDQVEVMAQNAKYSAIVVTGYFTYTTKSDMVCIDGKETNWRGKDVRGAIRVIQYSGCDIEFCPENRFAQVVTEIYTSVNKPDERRAVKKNRVITFPPVDARVEFLAQLPGVGLKYAESLLKWVGMMDKNADEDGYGSVASALHWVTILGGISKTSRPKGWGPEKILTVRKLLGLNSDQCMIIIKELETDQTKEPPAIEIDGKRWEQIPF